jgi:sugar/nucleoside kinase (ribokinase family)
MFDICCLGILVADVISYTVDSLPGEGRLIIVDSISLGVGGCAANSAIDLKKLGVDVAVIGKVGNDAFGSFILQDLSNYGIDITGINRSVNTPTSAANVLINRAGERSFIHCPGTNGNFCEKEVDFSIIEKSKILFIAGALLMPSLDGDPTMNILKKAKKHGIYTVLDTAWDATGRWMSVIGQCLPFLDLFIPSIEEAQILSGKSNVSDMADVFLSYGVSLCVIKQGKDGCYIKNSNGEELTIPSYTRIKAKDTNGAGDSFVAGFLTGILKGWDIKTCGRFANAVGAHCVSQIGTTTGIRPIEDILLFMEKYEEGIDII